VNHKVWFGGKLTVGQLLFDLIFYMKLNLGRSWISIW